MSSRIAQYYDSTYKKARKPAARYEQRVIFDWIKPRGTVLDIGCGDGFLLKMLKEKKNCQCVGLDISEQAVQTATQSGIEVYACDLNVKTTLGFNTESFDNVILCDILEHIFFPQTILQEATRVSRDNIFISIPNLAEYWNRFDLLLGRSPSYYHFGKSVWDSGHIRFFTVKDMVLKIRALGLKICREEHIYFHGPFRPLTKGYYLRQLWDLKMESNRTWRRAIYQLISRICDLSPNFFASISVFHIKKGNKPT